MCFVVLSLHLSFIDNSNIIANTHILYDGQMPLIQSTYPSIRSFLQPSTYPYLHPSIHLSIHFNLYQFSHIYIYPSIHSSIHAFTHLPTHPTTHSFVRLSSIIQFIPPSALLSTQLCTYSSHIHSFIYPPIHLLIWVTSIS